jgi:hypothetical protein
MKNFSAQGRKIFLTATSFFLPGQKTCVFGHLKAEEKHVFLTAGTKKKLQKAFNF